MDIGASVTPGNKTSTRDGQREIKKVEFVGDSSYTRRKLAGLPWSQREKGEGERREGDCVVVRVNLDPNLAQY